jgi:hypothetical protein
LALKPLANVEITRIFGLFVQTPDNIVDKILMRIGTLINALQKFVMNLIKIICNRGHVFERLDSNRKSFSENVI